MKQIKIVIIALEMYPTISARSFRTSELAKEFANQGHDVTLYTIWKNTNYTDFFKKSGVKIKNLGNLNFELGSNIIKKILNRLFAYPLIKLIPLIKEAVEKEGEIDFLITIAAPHQVHWGASFAISSKIKCWVADCGDPYMKNPYAFHPFYLKWFETRWCRLANFITVPIEEAKMAYYEEFYNKIHVIPQGFDFTTVKLEDYQENLIPTFAYAGNCYKKGRDITSFLEYLSGLKIDFKFLVYTKSDDFFNSFKGKLKGKMELKGFIPRDELLQHLSKVDFLINIKNDFSTQSPSKLIDYYLTERPILEISSNFDKEDFLNDFLNRDYKSQLLRPDISSYDIKNVATSFINLYNLKNNKDVQ